MSRVKIYRPSNTVTQSGKGRNEWVLEFVSDHKKYKDALMGWVGGSNSEIKLNFSSLDEAKAYAEKNFLQFTICNENLHRIKKKSYSDKFLSSVIKL